METEPSAPGNQPDLASQRLVNIDRRARDRVPLAGPYTELVWGPLVGPTAVLAARRLSLARLQPGDGSINLHVLASNLGVGYSDAQVVARGRRIVVALARAQHYGLIEWDIEHAVIGVSGWVPEVPPRLLCRLPPEARRHHVQILGTLGTSRTGSSAPAAVCCDRSRVAGSTSQVDASISASLEVALCVGEVGRAPEERTPTCSGEGAWQLPGKDWRDAMAGKLSTGLLPSESTPPLGGSALEAELATATDLMIVRLAGCATVWTDSPAELEIMADLGDRPPSLGEDGRHKRKDSL